MLNNNEGRRAGSKAQPRAALDGTGLHHGSFAGIENPAPKIMQMRKNFSGRSGTKEKPCSMEFLSAQVGHFNKDNSAGG